LDHETRDHAVKLRAVELLRLDVGGEVFDGLQRGIRIELSADFPGGRVELDLGLAAWTGAPAARAISAASTIAVRQNIGDSLVVVETGRAAAAAPRSFLRFHW
jgi:hypothetical protein